MFCHNNNNRKHFHFAKWLNIVYICFLLFTHMWKVLVVANGLKLLQVSIPPLKLTGQNARLACLYDLEGDALYSIKWYILAVHHNNNSYLNSLDFIDLTPRPLRRIRRPVYSA